MQNASFFRKSLRSLAIGGCAAFAAVILCFADPSLNAQSPTPEDGTVTLGGYRVVSSSEIGWRFSDIEGSENKYRSDLNYKSGFRSFDSNLLMESDSGKGKIFDSLLINNSGWGSDRNGFTRVNIEKIGIYKASGNVRRIVYFNDLVNHALNQSTRNTSHTMGDLDLTFLPQNERIRFKLGGSFNNTRGPGVTTHRAYSDEFAVDSFTRNRADDFRLGVEGKLLGFGLNLTQGFRRFTDRSAYTSTGLNLGNNPTNNPRLFSFTREFPTDGRTNYTLFNAQQTFAKKLDFTARVIYAGTTSDMAMYEVATGRDNSNNFVDLDRFDINSDSKRTQGRGDIGLTYMVTENFRISNTFTFDRFSLTGGEALEEALFRRNAAGNPLATVIIRSTGYRVNRYRRYVNTLEGDYQFNNRVGVHIGYRYTNREVAIQGIDQTLTSPPSGTNPRFITDNASNTTNALIAGTKIKPVKNWVIYADMEHGTADNVFTRLANYDYTNFRVRSRWTMDKFGLNVSAITKDNTNPTFNIVGPTNLDLTTSIKSRNFSASADWMPIPELSFNAGYTYNHLTTYTPIIVPAGGFRNGSSQYFVRDNFFHFDISASPVKRVTLFGSYRISKDRGQGGLGSTLPEIIITSYPMRFDSPEVRASIRLSRNIDWNVGYQYYRFDDTQTPVQNYRAHLPYVSLRFYVGRGR